jgi:hypothetical protein
MWQEVNFSPGSNSPLIAIRIKWCTYQLDYSHAPILESDQHKRVEKGRYPISSVAKLYTFIYYPPSLVQVRLVKCTHISMLKKVYSHKLKSILSKTKTCMHTHGSMAWNIICTCYTRVLTFNIVKRVVSCTNADVFTSKCTPKNIRGIPFMGILMKIKEC